jgi:archaellum component FlaC
MFNEPFKETPSQATSGSIKQLQNPEKRLQNTQKELQELEKNIVNRSIQQEELKQLTEKIQILENKVSQFDIFFQNFEKQIQDINIKLGVFTSGTEILREVHPLVLANNSAFIDIKNNQWSAITNTVYGTYEYTSPLAGTQRKYKIVIRNTSQAQPNTISPAGRGDLIKYRLFYSWVDNPDSMEYNGNLYWGNLNEGGWDTIHLEYLENPAEVNTHGKDYWQLQGCIFSTDPDCINRVFNVTLLVFDVL